MTVQFSSVQLFSPIQLFAITWTAACQAPLSITNSQSLPKLMSPESVMSSNHLILYHPSPSPPALNLSQHQGLFQSLHQVAKVLEFQFSVRTSNEYSGLISFRMDWLDLLAVQGTLKSSPIPQLQIISSSVLSFLYRPSLTSIHDYWKNHSFD